MMSFTGKWMGLDGEQHENRKEARFRQILPISYHTQNWYLKNSDENKRKAMRISGRGQERIMRTGEYDHILHNAVMVKSIIL